MGTSGKGDWGGGPWTKVHILGIFKHMKQRRTVPKGCIRKEMYELALERTEGLAENLAGIFNGMYTCNVCPIEWNTAEAAQLGKANGKKHARQYD